MQGFKGMFEKSKVPGIAGPELWEDESPSFMQMGKSRGPGHNWKHDVYTDIGSKKFQKEPVKSMVCSSPMNSRCKLILAVFLSPIPLTSLRAEYIQAKLPLTPQRHDYHSLRKTALTTSNNFTDRSQG